MDDAAIGAEIVVAQLREAVEAEPLDHQRVEMPGEEIGQVERARLLLGQRRERLLAGKEGVAMRALDAPHAFLGEDAVEFAAGAAVAVEAEDLVVSVRGWRGFWPASPRGCARGDCAGSPAGRSGRAQSSFSARTSRASAPQAMTSTSAPSPPSPRRRTSRRPRASTYSDRGLGEAIELGYQRCLGGRSGKCLRLARGPAASLAGARAGSWRSRPPPPRRGNRRRRRWRRRKPR